MCQGSEVKDKSTRMWHTPARSGFAACAFLAGGGRRAEGLVLRLSTAPSERPHFAVVSYDTASFRACYFGTVYQWHPGKIRATLNIVGGKQVWELFWVQKRLASYHAQKKKKKKKTTLQKLQKDLPWQQNARLQIKSPGSSSKMELGVRGGGGRAESRGLTDSFDQPLHPPPGAEQQ